ncbi:MAG: FAD-binding domain-containing protein [Burkholderiales bacterium]|nr:FAD-binding domain-containing protein [Burkholderiales bacterium]
MPPDLLTTAPTSWADALPPTRSAALARAGRVRPAAYARTRNHIDGAVTGLSPYLTHGIVTLREVLSDILSRERLAVEHKLVYEFGWREYFRHAWAHEGDGILQSLHAGPMPEDAYARTLPADIREARTGVPVIDESVRTLYATGTLHNHARMWLASYVVHLRRVHWRVGADWLVAHLLDGDLASNHLSWQWVAGTGSHKPYLFNAENVAKYAPPHWHSAGTVIDQTYEALDHIARGGVLPLSNTPGVTVATAEPELLALPPANLSIRIPDAKAAEELRGRDVWLVHPWALRAPPANVPNTVVVIGLYPREHHAAWPWPEARRRWVDAAMARIAPQRYVADSAALALLLQHAANIRSVADPHITRWLHDVATLDAAPILFPPVERRCTSFSQWWTRTTRGLRHAEELL